MWALFLYVEKMHQRLLVLSLANSVIFVSFFSYPSFLFPFLHYIRLYFFLEHDRIFWTIQCRTSTTASLSIIVPTIHTALSIARHKQNQSFLHLLKEFPVVVTSINISRMWDCFAFCLVIQISVNLARIWCVWIKIVL